MNHILDQGELKSTPEIIMAKKLSYYVLALRRSDEWKWVTTTFNERDLKWEQKQVPNEDYQPAPPLVRYAIKLKDDRDLMIAEYNMDKNNRRWAYDSLEVENKKFIERAGGEEAIHEYLGIKPFIPSVMINISPDWTGFDLKNCQSVKIKNLSTIVEEYLKEGNRYTKASYVIENGSNGDFIHAHVVAEMNPKLIKSVNTHLAKGNHTQQLIKQSKKVKGMEGTIKGVGVHKVFLRTEELVSDKLDYLIEAKKPEGHKNKNVIFKKKDLVF